MPTGISALGDRQLTGTFGWENNELHRHIYLEDPRSQLNSLLNLLLGTPVVAEGIPLPMSFPCNSTGANPEYGVGFFAYSVAFESEDKGLQGDTEVQGAFGLLGTYPFIRGGLKLDIIYRPMQTVNATGYNDWTMVADETWDFSAQTMSLIGLNYGGSPDQVFWSDGATPVGHLQTIAKIIPKIEFTQKRIWCWNLPNESIRSLIGCINGSPLTIGNDPGAPGGKCQWPVGTALLVGLPSVRRWRFDGVPVFEVQIKLAINTFRDKLEDGSFDYVTWNRLFRIGDPNRGISPRWEKVKIGTGADVRGIFQESSANGIPDMNDITKAF